MVDAVLNRQKWAPSTESPSPRSWAEHGEAHVLSREHILADGIISVLNRLYEFRGGLTVEEFLRNNIRENASLVSILLAAPRVIRDHFGSDARVALEVVADPEAPADQQLFVVIRTKFPASIARALLAELDRGWWQSASPAAQGKLELDIE